MRVDSDTKICVSIAAKAGNTGTTIQNALYEKHDLNYLYKSFEIDNLEDAIKGIRAFGFRGCAVSSPYKKEVVQYLDGVSGIAEDLQIINTVVNFDGRLYGYNTDYHGLVSVLDDVLRIAPNKKVLVVGAGAIAEVALHAFRTLFPDYSLSLYNRSGSKAKALLKQQSRIGFVGCCDRVQQLDSLEEDNSDVLIDCTSIGLHDEVFPLSDQHLKKYSYIFDVVNKETNLIKRASKLKIPCQNGKNMAIVQSLCQFELYTSKLLDRKEEMKFVEALL